MDKVTGSKPKHYPSIYRKILLSFGVFTIITFSVFGMVIYQAENQMEVISLHHWLDTEAKQYQMEYLKAGDAAELPDPSEFSTYLSQASAPEWLRAYQTPGFFEHLLGTEDKHFLVAPHPSGQDLMYIVFQDDADDYLDEYESNLHINTVLIGVISSLLMAFYGSYVVYSLARPLTRIKQKIMQMPPDQPTFDVDTAYEETRLIEQTLLDSKNDISAYFQREKEFSRFASHELRTPIMVIQGSTDLLAQVPALPPIAQKAVGRLQDASTQMRVLTEAFLLLGKAHIEEHHFSAQRLSDALNQQLTEMAPLFAKQGASYQLSVSEPATVHAPSSFISIIINNLIKNAFSYSIGDIKITLCEYTLTITNRHNGHETYNAGYGCGLVIVQRICERMNWTFNTDDNGSQFIATIRFSNGKD